MLSKYFVFVQKYPLIYLYFCLFLFKVSLVTAETFIILSDIIFGVIIITPN